MLKSDICITEISQAILETFNLEVDIPRKSPRIRISLNASIKVDNNRIHDVINDLLIINCVAIVLCGSPKPDLREHTPRLLISFQSIREHAPENRVGTLKQSCHFPDNMKFPDVSLTFPDQ